MIKLEENNMFTTPKTKEELNTRLEDLGSNGVMGAMFMMNFIAKQYKEGNIEQ